LSTPSRDDVHTLDLDSHAHQAVVGRDCHIISDTGEEIEVYGYDAAQGSVRRRIVSACFAYDDPATGQVVLLVVHQAIHVPHLENSLIPPAQLRCNDIIVRDCPKTMMDNPTTLDHTIQIPIEGTGDSFVIHLLLRDTTSYVPVRKPSDAELLDDHLLRFELTYETPVWDPTSPQLMRREAILHQHAVSRQATRDQTDHPIVSEPKRQTWIGSVTSRAIMSMANQISSQSSAVLAGISSILDNDNFHQMLQGTRLISSVHATKRSNDNILTAEGLAKRWMISLHKAKQTLEATSQRMVRERPNDLVRRFKTNDRLIRYNRINANMYTDTMFTNVVSRRMNKCAQVFVIPELKWVSVMALRSKGDAHLALDHVFRTTGVPNTLICDGSKEQILGTFKQKCRDAGVNLHPTEPYSPWSDLAEGYIRELKKKSRRRMCAGKVPKRLWDDCLEYEADIMSHTAHDTYELQGQVPQSVVTGQLVDISRLAEFAFYDWIYWYDNTASYPDEKKTLGRYLGPSRDYGSAMCAKILKKNGQIRICSTFIAVSREDKLKAEVIAEMQEFDQSITQKLGELATLQDFPEDDTPAFERYVDDDQDEVNPIERDAFDVDAYDPYLNAEVELPVQGEMITGRVKRRKRDAEGNLVGRADAHPLLDTREYVVEFPDGREAEYAANLIATNMIAQCDTEGNQFLLMNAIVDHEKTEKAVPSLKVILPSGDEEPAGRPPKVGNCVLSGRMVQPHGRTCLFSKNTILSK
jgi:hypothetical protein